MFASCCHPAAGSLWFILVRITKRTSCAVHTASQLGKLESRQTGQHLGCVGSCSDSVDILVSHQLTHQILCPCRVAVADHVEAVSPGGPERGETTSGRVALLSPNPPNASGNVAVCLGWRSHLRQTHPESRNNTAKCPDSAVLQSLQRDQAEQPTKCNPARTEAQWRNNDHADCTFVKASMRSSESLRSCVLRCKWANRTSRWPKGVSKIVTPCLFTGSTEPRHTLASGSNCCAMGSRRSHSSSLVPVKFHT